MDQGSSKTRKKNTEWNNIDDTKKRKSSKIIENEIILTMPRKGKAVKFEGKDMKLEGKNTGQRKKSRWKQVKKCLKIVSEEEILEQYLKTEMQSDIYKKQEKKCNIWKWKIEQVEWWNVFIKLSRLMRKKNTSGIQKENV